MRLQVAGIGIVVAALAAIGCSDRSQSLPAAPRMQTTASTSSALVCDFKNLGNLATHYFSGPEAKLVRDTISAMQNAGAFSTTARDLGFTVMAHIASNVKAGNSDVADASNLTNGLLVCMYNPATNDTAALPESFKTGVPEDFTVATNPADSGAYDVRGRLSDGLGAVFSRPLFGSFSGVSPCADFTQCDNSWPKMLAGNSPVRLLVYGEPVGPPNALPNTYEWRVVPRNTSFSPPAIVAVCLDAGTNGTSLIHENDALLPFADAPFLPTCSGLATQSWSSQLASRVARWGIGLFGPKPLSATTYLNPGGLAGSTGSIHSLFGPQEVNTVTLAIITQPHDTVVNTDFGPVVVTVTTMVEGTPKPVPNVVVTLTAVNNNGTPAILQGQVTDTTDATGLLTFDPLKETKTGAYTIVVSGVVIGRDAIAVPTVTSVRFNIRP
jgi:hypothetical protein